MAFPEVSARYNHLPSWCFCPLSKTLLLDAVIVQCPTQCKISEAAARMFIRLPKCSEGCDVFSFRIETDRRIRMVYEPSVARIICFPCEHRTDWRSENSEGVRQWVNFSTLCPACGEAAKGWVVDSVTRETVSKMMSVARDQFRVSASSSSSSSRVVEVMFRQREVEISSRPLESLKRRIDHHEDDQEEEVEEPPLSEGDRWRINKLLEDAAYGEGEEFRIAEKLQKTSDKINRRVAKRAKEETKEKEREEWTHFTQREHRY